MAAPPDGRFGYLLALLSAAAFGVLPVLAKLAFAEGLDVPTLLVWRFGIACLLLWALVLAGAGDARAPAGRVQRPTAIEPSRRLALVALGGLYAVNAGLYFLALERMPASATSLIFYVYPASVALLGAMMLDRRLRRVELVSLVTALLGVILTVGLARGGLDPIGVVLALAAAAVVSLYFVLTELAAAGFPTLHATALVITGTALAYGAWEWARGGLRLPPTARAWALVGVIATLSTAIAILALIAAIRRIGAGRTSILGTLEPAITAALATLALGERLAPQQYAGGALILAAVALLRLSARRAAAPWLADT